MSAGALSMCSGVIAMAIASTSPLAVNRVAPCSADENTRCICTGRFVSRTAGQISAHERTHPLLAAGVAPCVEAMRRGGEGDLHRAGDRVAARTLVEHAVAAFDTVLRQLAVGHLVGGIGRVVF